MIDRDGRGEGDALVHFDASASVVFTVACHLSAGRPTAALRLLVDTYTEERAGDIDTLVLTAHRLSASRPTPPIEPLTVPPGDAPRAGVVAELSPLERVVLSIVEIEHADLGIAVAALDITAEDATHALDAARVAVADTGSTGAQAFAATEIWLDDAMRASARALVQRGATTTAITGETPDATPATRTTAHSRRRPRSTQRTWVSVAVVAACVIGAAVAWRLTGPTTRPSNGSSTPVSTLPSPATNVASGLPSGAAGSLELASYEPLAGVTDESVITMATGLTDIEPARPDAIVRFADGRIGLSWTGPCNRPAAAVQVGNGIAGVVTLRLLTGSFRVVSCFGMPTHWTAVVPLPADAAPGRIVPSMTGAGLSAPFDGYSAVDSASDETSLHENGSAGYGSALLDADDHPWAFTRDCSTLDRIRYPAPDVRAAPTFYAVRLGAPTGSCPSTSKTPHLVGPSGEEFPYAPHRDGGTTAVPADCHGPAGSGTNIDASTPATDAAGDVVTTWDGCSVSPAFVIVTRPTFACGGATAVIVTFGDPIGRPIEGETHANVFIRDPDGVVGGQVAPLLPSVAMPDDSADTGVRIGSDRLWLASSTPNALYVVTDHGVQRWPRFTPFSDTCAAGSTPSPQQ